MTNTQHKHIGILGGTFDPIHIAHLRLAIDLKISTNISEIRLIPNFLPPHKNTQVTDIKHRLNMLNLATENLQNIIVDQTEIEIAKENLKNNQNYKSYMTDTLDVLNKKFNSLYQNNYTLWLILGADSFMSFNTWHKWQNILKQTNFLILKRDNQNITNNLNWLESVKHQVTISNETNDSKLPDETKSGYVYLKNSRQLNISATEIRSLISSSQPANFLLPDQVLKYIKINHLYK